MDYTIKNESLNITRHTTLKGAKSTINAHHFDDEDGLAELVASWPAARLIEIWNSLPHVHPVRKFTDRKTAVKRIWNAIQCMPVSAGNFPTEEREKINAQESPADSGAEPVLKSASSAALPATSAAPVAPQTPHVAPDEAPANTRSTRAKKAPEAPAKNGMREGSKTTRVIDLLKRQGAVTLKEITTEMG